jgi:hypothetical protein
MSLETFAASAAFLSLYFLLHAQKKVPKKRAATAKRQPPASRPLIQCAHRAHWPDCIRHIRSHGTRASPKAPCLPKKLQRGLAVASTRLPHPVRPLRVRPLPKCTLRERCIPARPGLFGRDQPHISSFHLRDCHLRYGLMAYSENLIGSLPWLHSKRRSPKVYKGAMFSSKTRNRP